MPDYFIATISKILFHCLVMFKIKNTSLKFTTLSSSKKKLTLTKSLKFPNDFLQILRFSGGFLELWTDLPLAFCFTLPLLETYTKKKKKTPKKLTDGFGL